MGFTDDAIREQISRDQSWAERAWSCKFSRDVLSISTKAYVILPMFDEKYEWGPCRWMPRYTPLTSTQKTAITLSRPDDTFANVATDINALKLALGQALDWITGMSRPLPKRGDGGLAMFNENRELWVVAWWPY